MIDYKKLRSLPARQLISALERDGFRLRRSRGGHHRYVHPDGRRVTVTLRGRGGEEYVSCAPLLKNTRAPALIPGLASLTFPVFLFP